MLKLSESNENEAKDNSRVAKRTNTRIYKAIHNHKILMVPKILKTSIKITFKYVHLCMYQEHTEAANNQPVMEPTRYEIYTYTMNSIHLMLRYYALTLHIHTLIYTLSKSEILTTTL